MKRKIYVASSWRNEHQQEVVETLRRERHFVYDFKNPGPGEHGFSWSEIDKNWQDWTPKQYTDALFHPIAEHGFDTDMDALKASDTCVLVLPCGRSAHLEAGYAVGAGLDVYIYMPPETKIEPELMYKMCSGIFTDITALIARLSYATSYKVESKPAPPVDSYVRNYYERMLRDLESCESLSEVKRRIPEIEQEATILATSLIDYSNGYSK